MSNQISKKIARFILLLYLAVFSFGQIPALILGFAFNTSMSVHLTDILVLSFVLVSFIGNKILRKNFLDSFVFKCFVILGFSYIFGSVFLSSLNVTGFLYLVRICSYLAFGYILLKEKLLSKNELMNFFVVAALVISVLGLLQYIVLPDTRFLKYLGWDDHYFRLISTFLDPAFTAILLVFSLIFSVFAWKPEKPLFKAFVVSLITVALLLTYSRASYLSLFAGVVGYSIARQNIKLKYIAFAVLFALSLFFLPRPAGGEGVKLERTFSVFLKINNSADTIAIGQMSPVFGVGYNNLCLAKTLMSSQKTSLISHSCSGADNSILFIFSTMGIVGLLMFGWGTVKFIRENTSPVMLAVFSSLFIHTQFTNTLFYPWVFVWIVLCGLFERVKEQK